MEYLTDTWISGYQHTWDVITILDILDFSIFFEVRLFPSEPGEGSGALTLIVQLESGDRETKGKRANCQNRRLCIETYDEIRVSLTSRSFNDDSTVSKYAYVVRKRNPSPTYRWEGL